MKRFFVFVLLFLLSASALAAPELPPEVFELVQATERTKYYFNKEHIAYGVNDKGIIDFNTIVCPAVKIYDPVQIDDVVTKRRWHGKPMEGYNRLAGSADYLSFNISAGTVAVYRHEDLDDTWTKIGAISQVAARPLSSFKENEAEGKFYRAILAYAAEHKKELLAHTGGILSEHDEARLNGENAEAEGKENP